MPYIHEARSIELTMINPSERGKKYAEDPVILLRRARAKLHSLWIAVTYPFASIGNKASFHPTCVLSRRFACYMNIGCRVTIHQNVWLNIVPDGVESIKIAIDDRCSIGARNTISARNFVHIEKDVLSGPSVLIQDHNHEYKNVDLPIQAQGTTDGGRFRIGHGCWIGHGAAIICNEGDLVIGHNCVIGANAVVTKSFPPYSVIVGSPARVVKRYDPLSGRWRRELRRDGRDEIDRALST